MLLRDFANRLDDVAATSSKLAKTRIIGDVLRELDEVELKLAVRYAAGRAFAATDERVLGTSSAIISQCVINLLAIDATTWRSATINHGEIGEAIAAVWPTPDSSAEPVLTLVDLADAFDALAATTQPSEKRPTVERLLSRSVDPREACYIGKIMLGDLRAGAREGVMQAAVAEAFGVTLAEVLRAQLMIGDLDEVAALAKSGDLTSAQYRPFRPLGFMLATPVESAGDAPGIWTVEDKLDGIRAQAHRGGGKTALYTRTHDRTDDSFPDVVEQLSSFDIECVLDGEIVPWRDGRALPFAVLQKRLGRKNVSADQLEAMPAVFIAFDLLFCDGQLLLDRPLVERQRLLRELAARYPSLLVLPEGSADTPEKIAEAFTAARDAGNEGLMLKDPQSLYTPGRRGGAWLKLKGHLPTLDCVVTAAEYGHGKRRKSLSDYTFAVWTADPSTDPAAKLLNVGKAFSGVTDEEIAELTATFLSSSVSDNGRVFQVRPAVVLEIAFDQILLSKRHASGYALRFPRIKAIRRDKPPEQADTLARVRDIYSSRDNLGQKHLQSEEPVKTTKKKMVSVEPTLFDSLE